MAKRRNPKNLSIIKQLAEQLGVDLEDSKIAIATEKTPAKAKMYDDSLEATVISGARPTVRIESPRAPGIYIELVDHHRDLAPEGAIYCIRAYLPDPTQQTLGGGESLNGDIYTAYIGRKGIILDNAARQRASKLPMRDDEF